MLERARATSLALLGATAAVGLGIVALALNQSWPLLEGNPIPAAPRQEVGKAAVVARPAHAARARSGTVRRPNGGQPGPVRAGAPARRQTVAETPSGGEEAEALVVSQQTPARPPGGKSPKAPPKQGKAPGGHAKPSPSPTAQPPAGAPTSSPPPSAPATRPESAPPAPAPPEAVASEAPPEESNVPPWSHGEGHAYGREEDRHEGDHGYGGDHGWGHGD